jgi:hypothetical protein
MLGAKRRHRSQNQAERRAKPARRPSRCIYPKTAARKLHQSRSVLKNQNPQNGQHWARFDWGFGAICFGASPVAAVFGSAPGSATPPEHRIHCKPLLPGSHPKTGHFYFAGNRTFLPCLDMGSRFHLVSFGQFTTAGEVRHSGHEDSTSHLRPTGFVGGFLCPLTAPRMNMIKTSSARPE